MKGTKDSPQCGFSGTVVQVRAGAAGVGAGAGARGGAARGRWWCSAGTVVQIRACSHAQPPPPPPVLLLLLLLTICTLPRTDQLGRLLLRAHAGGVLV